MGAVKRTHPRAVVRQKIKKYTRRDPDTAELMKIFFEMFEDLFLYGIDMASEPDQTGFVDRSIFPECVWEKLEAHDEPEN